MLCKMCITFFKFILFTNTVAQIFLLELWTLVIFPYVSKI